MLCQVFIVSLMGVADENQLFKTDLSCLLYLLKVPTALIGTHIYILIRDLFNRGLDKGAN